MTERSELTWNPRQFVKNLPDGFSGRLLWQYGGTLVTVICGFAYTILLARNLGASNFGTVALALGVATLCMQLFHVNMRDFAIRYVSIGLRRNEPNTLISAAGISFVVNIALMTLFYIILALSLKPITALLGQPEKFRIILAIAACTPILQVGLTDSLTGVLRGLNQVRDIAFIMAATSIIRLVWTWIGLKVFAAGVVEVLLISAASVGIGAATFLLLTILRVRRETVTKISVAKLKQFFREYRPTTFMRRNYFINLLSLPTKELDTVVLGMFATLDSVGIYRVAKNFMNAVWAIADPLHLVIYPELARLWSNDSLEKIRQFLKTIAIGLLVTAIVVVTVSYLAAPIVIEKLVGPEFAQSATLFLIMITSVIIWFPLAWVHPLFLASGRNELSLRAAVVHSIVTTVLFVCLGYLAATTGIAISYSLSLALISLLQLHFMIKAKLLAR